MLKTSVYNLKGDRSFVNLFLKKILIGGSRIAFTRLKLIFLLKFCTWRCFSAWKGILFKI